MIAKSLFLLLLSFLPLQAQSLQQNDTFDTLSGPLPSHIKAQKKPYLVTTNIEVPFDNTVIIDPGVIFLFRNFAGLHVRGRLIAIGTAQKPIIFTSEFNKLYNQNSPRDANPFDWDGIYLTSDAMGTQMSHCQISYTVYGISSDTKFLKLNPVYFKDNGKSVISIENQEIPVQDTLFQYFLDKKENGSEELNLFKDPHIKKRVIFRIASLAIITGGIASTGYFAYKWHNAADEYRFASSDAFENLHRNGGVAYWNAALKKRNKYVFYTGSTILVTVIGGIGFGWTFTF